MREIGDGKLVHGPYGADQLTDPARMGSILVEDELRKGDALAKAVIEHLERMGVASCTIPIEIHGETYTIGIAVYKGAWLLSGLPKNDG